MTADDLAHEIADWMDDGHQPADDYLPDVYALLEMLRRKGWVWTRPAKVSDLRPDLTVVE